MLQRVHLTRSATNAASDAAARSRHGVLEERKKKLLAVRFAASLVITAQQEESLVWL